MPPTVPINHFFKPKDQQNKLKDLFYYSMLMYSNAIACLKHSIFFKVNGLNPLPTHLRAERSLQRIRPGQAVLTTKADRQSQSEIQLRAF